VAADGNLGQGRAMDRSRGVALLLCALIAVSLPALTAAGSASTAAAPTTVRGTYLNPLRPTAPNGRTVEGCADPAVTRGYGAYAKYWYMYCTSDPLNDAATSGRGAPVFTRLPTMRSRDLVHWAFVNSALPGKPSWAGSKAKLWAPDVVYSSTYHRYYLTFAVTDTATSVSGQASCTSDSAVGVAVSSSPTGPWRIRSTPLVPPRRLGAGCRFADTIDPDVLGYRIPGRSVLYFGSFAGGILAQPVTLSSTGMRTTGTPTQVTIGRRYEAANVVVHDGWYYLFVSSGSCCQGPMSGYGVFAGRSRSAYGPFLDREGASLLAGRTGGTPALVTNGNDWVGPGHSSAFPDTGGQWWTVYHAISRSDPFYATEPGFTRRPPMLDPLDWVDGWPSVRSGTGASGIRMPAPAAQAQQRTAYRPKAPAPDVLGAALPAYSDTFDDDTLDPAWTWVRPPDPTTYAVEDGALRFDTQDAGLSGSGTMASVLTRAAPTRDYVVQTAVRLDVPAAGCCHDYVQAGLLIRGSDDRYVKLTHASIGETRQIELGTKVPAGKPGYPRTGATTVGPPGDTTWLRIVRRSSSTRQTFRGYSSTDGTHWVRGGTWVQSDLGAARIGLVSLGGAGFSARFDDVRVWELGG
jgi:arabinan endo-1,5-alpha-L-arabinosidase